MRMHDLPSACGLGRSRSPHEPPARGRGRALGLLALALAACGGAGATFDGHVYHRGDVSFAVGSVPSSWRQVHVDQDALAFRDDAQQASILVAGQCGVSSDDVPLVALTNQLIMGTTERQYTKEETLSFDGREARHTVLHAKLDGVPLVWDIYVLKKNGCVYDMVYAAPPARFDEGAPSFERFAADFRTVDTGTP